MTPAYQERAAMPGDASDDGAATAATLNAILHYGYLPSWDDFLKDPLWQDLRAADRQSLPDGEHGLVQDGARLWIRLFRDLLDRKPKPPFVVPLSGGLDSRAILCGLLRHVDTKDVVTATVGVPGALDFEIGRQVARACRVSHEAIDLRSVPFSVDSLVAHAAELQRPLPVFESYLFHQIRRIFGADVSYWMGFLGETLAGAHLRQEPSRTWDAARHWFAKWNAATRRMRLTPQCYRPTDSLPREPLLYPSHLTLDDQLDFAIRQYSFLRPIVLLPGYRYVTPFAEREWVNFMLSVPTALRRNQCFYKMLLSTAFPREFALPVKGTYGLPPYASDARQRLRRLVFRGRSVITTIFGVKSIVRNPYQNYIDFGRALATRGDLSNSCRLLVDGFAERGLLSQPDLDRALWDKTLGINRFSSEICLIASVECFIRAGTLKPTVPSHLAHERREAERKMVSRTD